MNLRRAYCRDYKEARELVALFKAFGFNAMCVNRGALWNIPIELDETAVLLLQEVDLSLTTSAPVEVARDALREHGWTARRTRRVLEHIAKDGAPHAVLDSLSRLGGREKLQAYIAHVVEECTP